MDYLIEAKKQAEEEQTKKIVSSIIRRMNAIDDYEKQILNLKKEISELNSGKVCE